MIISRAPFRISFTGGGSDMVEFYKHSPGAVISTSIDKYMYLTLHQYFDFEKIHLKYSKSELVSKYSQIKHPIFRTVLKEIGINGVEISSVADIPSGTGLGSSSAFTVALWHCLSAFQKKSISKIELAEKACYTEIDLLREPIGKQDQYATAFGGLNFIYFDPSGKVEIDKLSISDTRVKELEGKLMMFYTGISRYSKNVLSEQKKNVISSKRKFKSLELMVKMTFELRKCIENGSLDDMGEILNRSWLEKKSLASNISNPIVDHYYNLAIQHGGALGGKLLGAGNGGFLLFYVQKEKQEKLKKVLCELREFDFKFSDHGTEIIFNEEL